MSSAYFFNVINNKNGKERNGNPFLGGSVFVFDFHVKQISRIINLKTDIETCHGQEDHKLIVAYSSFNQALIKFQVFLHRILFTVRTGTLLLSLISLIINEPLTSAWLLVF